MLPSQSLRGKNSVFSLLHCRSPSRFSLLTATMFSPDATTALSSSLRYHHLCVVSSVVMGKNVENDGKCLRIAQIELVRSQRIYVCSHGSAELPPKSSRLVCSFPMSVCSHEFGKSMQELCGNSCDCTEEEPARTKLENQCRNYLGFCAIAPKRSPLARNFGGLALNSRAST
ncbi:uncharacterized protein [Spinacia oleracea]|uniref:VDE lipocalin domain-containing protein n=1 Tax=Spinacia oleracea TaxID=3562 RepID=A0ABM3R730_SPIOL|nr:uncharacterized protein LOC130466874 [Spinacia oleracea]